MIDPASSSPGASGTGALPNGPAWAALLAAGIGCVSFGVITDISESSARVSRALQWYSPAGSLSGVAMCAIVIWLIAWAALHARWRDRQLANQRTLMTATFLLILAALVTTFPPFYGLFASGG